MFWKQFNSAQSQNIEFICEWCICGIKKVYAKDFIWKIVGKIIL